MKQSIHLLLLTLLFVLTGCWDKYELNDLAIATGLAIDQSEDGYMVSVQTVNPSEISTQTSTSGISPITVRAQTGETMYDAIRKLSTTNSNRLYGSHLQLLVISEDIAKEGIADILDYLSRDNDFRADFFIVISKNTSAQTILKMQTVTDLIPTTALTSLLDVSEEISGSTVTIDLKEILTILTTPGRSALIPLIDITGDLTVGQTKANTESSVPAVTFSYLGSGVFNKDKLIGSLNTEETKAFHYINDDIQHVIETLPCPNNEKISIEVLRSKTKQEAVIAKDSKPKIEINVQTETNVGETNCSINLTNPAEIITLEKAIEEKISRDLNDLIDKVQTEFKSDVFGFGETIYRSYPTVWSELSDDWGNYFSNLDVQITVAVTNSQLGSTKNSLKQDIRE